MNAGCSADKRADAPARTHVRRHQARDDARGAIRGHDARPQQMARVGCDAQHLALLAIQHERVEAALLVPERVVEATEQRRRLVAQRGGALGAAEFVVDLRHAQPGVIDIALQFAHRLGPFHRRAVGVVHRIAGILPRHVLVADRRARLVFLEAVAVAIAPVVDPRQAALGRVEMPFQQRAIAGGAPRGVQRDQVQRRRIRRAVIRRVRDQLEMREFAVAQFVHDLARFGVAIVVALLRLPAAEHVERAARELRIDQDVLQ